MYNLTAGLLVTVFLNTITIADAAYVIKLKNGNEYITSRYWKDGAQVLFDTYGGVFGIDHGFVVRIEPTDKAIRLVSIAPRDPAERAQSETAKTTTDKEPTNSEAKKDAKSPDDPIIGELNHLKQKAKGVDGLLTEEIRELLREITAFRMKLIKDRKLFLGYPQEINDISNLSNVVEASLRSRTD